ncbi:MAG: glycosyltransferase [Verrucomicrobiota bacterium]|nr:glycosyltransferase [Verrucomicrobiota bacterium]
MNPANGGPGEVIKQLVPIHAAAGHSAEVVSVDAPELPCLGTLPFPVTALGPAKSGYGYTRALTRWLQRHVGEFDCVLSHGLWKFHGVAIQRASRARGVPYFVFPHGMLDPWFKRTYPLKHAKKMLYWLLVERRVLREAAGVLFTAEEERACAEHSFGPFAARKEVVAFGTGRPPEEAARQRAAFFEQFPALERKRLVLFLSRIHRKKGCDLLIEAFAREMAAVDPAWHLVMAGPDQVGWQRTLLDLSRRLGIADRITWTGMLQGEVKWGAFRAAEAFVLPSHQENFGVAVAEALACGLPVLVSNGVNIWREIERDGAGLVRDATLEGTAALLREWRQLSLEEHKRMAGQAAHCFSARFEICRAAESLIGTLDSLRGGRGLRLTGHSSALESQIPSQS